MIGMLVTDRDEVFGDGKVKCVSCYHLNCWHEPGDACDIDGCACNLGAWQDAPYANAGGRGSGRYAARQNIVGASLRADRREDD
jgi:hypothetical protein